MNDEMPDSERESLPEPISNEDQPDLNQDSDGDSIDLGL